MNSPQWDFILLTWDLGISSQESIPLVLEVKFMGLWMFCSLDISISAVSQKALPRKFNFLVSLIHIGLLEGLCER